MRGTVRQLVAVSLPEVAGRLRARPARGLPRAIWVLAMGTAVLAAIPLVYIVVRALGGGLAAAPLVTPHLLRYAVNTLALTALVTLLSVLIGVALAWLVERSSLPYRGTWRWLLALPLAMPPYVVAVCYMTLLRPGGLLADWQAAAGLALPIPSPFGLVGAAIVITLGTYPYVFLLASAALRHGSHALEELARSCGYGPWRTFWTTTLPLLRPAIGAGAVLAALYALSDFGVVALLRHHTFTYAIYSQFTAGVSRSSAAQLSLPLAAITLVLLWVEGRAYQRGSFAQLGHGWRPCRPRRLGRWRWLAVLLPALVIAAALLLPLALLSWWTILGLLDQSQVARTWAATGPQIWQAAWNSLWTAALGATLASLLALAPAIVAVRARLRLGRWVAAVAQAGYALPGVIVALSLVLLINRALPWLAGTAAGIVLAYVLRFMPQALQAHRTGLQAVPGTLDEAARSLGHSPLAALRRVSLPLVVPGMAAGWALVFLSALKELPATLLLRPAGFDTLPVRVWIPATESLYTHAAPAALLLCLCAIVPLFLLLTRSRIGIARLV